MPPAAAAPDSAAAAWTGQVGEPTRLVLLRHGQTELSVQRRYSGHGDPELHASWLGSEQVAPPGGESFFQVGRRIEDELKQVLADYPGATVVLVSHVTPIKCVLRQALQGGPGILYRLHLDLASISIVDLYPDGGASVRLVNDISHSPALG
jgi:broad specificity phosphatase PhoE